MIFPFNYTEAGEIKINDGLIKSIFIEGNKSPTMDSDGEIELTTGGDACIEFENGKKLYFSTSEWGQINCSELIVKELPSQITLSKSQNRVIQLMRDNYELGYYGGIKQHVTIQQGKLGYGGNAEKVLIPTFEFLLKMKLISRVKCNIFNCDLYNLSEFGKKVTIIQK